jgi:hypothetical protein
LPARAESTDRLAELSGDYTERLNLLLDEGRADLAAGLADAYERDVLESLTRHGRS